MRIHAPTVSVGIPVRNAEHSIGRTVESALSQKEVDLEVVISDNASDDGTETICRSYAAAEPRVRYDRVSRNAGQIVNFNRVFSLSTGRYFRWLGAGDELGPGYAAACVAALDADPGKVVVTTPFHYLRDDGSTIEAGWVPGPAHADPIHRLHEVLRLLNAGYLAIDPVYGMIRRSALERRPLLRPQMLADQLLTVELTMAGRFGHVPRLLATRQHPRFLAPAEAAVTYGVPLWRARLASIALCRSIARMAVEEPGLTAAQRRAALRAVAVFYAQRHAGNTRRRARKAATLLTR